MRTAILAVIGLTLIAETVGGLRWTPPAGWRSEGAAPMRAATYKIPPASEDHEGAECVIDFIGAGDGGGQTIIERWKSKFKEADGKHVPAQIHKRTGQRVAGY